MKCIHLISFQVTAIAYKQVKGHWRGRKYFILNAWGPQSPDFPFLILSCRIRLAFSKQLSKETSSAKTSTALRDPRSIYVSSLAHIPFKKYPAGLKRIHESVFDPSVIPVFLNRVLQHQLFNVTTTLYLDKS